MPPAVSPISPPPAAEELARTPLRRIMRSGVVSVSGNASLLQAAKALADHRVHAVLVLRTGSSERVGWLTTRALVERCWSTARSSRSRTQ